MTLFQNPTAPTPEELELAAGQFERLVKVGQMTEEEKTQTLALPPSLIVVIYESKKDEIDGIEKQLELEKGKKDAWKNKVGLTQRPTALELKDIGVPELKQLKLLLHQLGGRPVQQGTVKFKNGEEDLDYRYLKLTGDLAQYLVPLVLADKEKAEAEYEESIKPKPKKSGGGTRSKFEGERVVKNPDAWEGKDHKFAFKGDEDAFFDKPSGKPKDGKQTLIRKSIKSNRYLGGAESKCDDGKCCGAVGWDRAQGSEAIKKTGLSYALFKQRCGEKADADGFCKKCGDKGDKKLNFFEDSYVCGKGVGKKFNGVVFKAFIVNNLEYAVVAENAD